MSNIIYITAAIVTLVGVASGSSPHTRPLPLGGVSVKASGVCFEVNKVICSKDCKQLFLCVQDEGAWAPVLIDTCGAGLYCNNALANCTTSLTTCSPTEPPVFQLHCTATGHFPDPYDCTVYHECATIGELSTVSACPSDWSYNALTTNCDHRVSDGVCFPYGLIPACRSAGQSGPVPENDNIYYVCLQTSTGLLHELFKCAHGGHYSAGTCREGPNTPPTTTPFTTTFSTTTKKPNRAS